MIIAKKAALIIRTQNLMSKLKTVMVKKKRSYQRKMDCQDIAVQTLAKNA